MFIEERKKVGGQRDNMFGADKYIAEKVEATYKEVLIELQEIVEMKQLIEAEEKMTEEVRRRILEIKNESLKQEQGIFKL